MVGNLDDLLDVLDRERVFLSGDFEAHELHLVSCLYRLLRHGVGLTGTGLLSAPLPRTRIAFEKPDRIEDHDHPSPVGRFDHAAEKVRIDRRLDRTNALDLIRLRRDDRRHFVDDETDRDALIDNDHARRVVVIKIRVAEDPAEAGDGHHRAAQVSQAFQARVTERYLNDIRHPDDLLHFGQRHRKDAVVDVEGHVLPGFAGRAGVPVVSGRLIRWGQRRRIGHV